MTEMELAIWSAACGAIALVVLVCAADVVMTRTAAAAQGTGYNLAALLFVVLLSGLPRELLPSLPDGVLHTSQVMIGPLCAFLGDYWIRGWLGARHRDRLMDRTLLAAALASPLLATAAVFLLPAPMQLPTVAILVLVNTGILVWMCFRAWLLGDRLALGIAIGSVLMLVAVGGLYGLALGVPGLGTAWQAVLAIVSVLCLTMIGIMLWKRNEHERRVRGFEPVRSQFDPVTKLRQGAPFVRQLIRAQERRRITRREGAVIAVMIFQPERIVTQAGASALNEVYVQVAQRLQRQVGAVNPVGRYWDRCFVALAESIHSPAALRTMGLRVATAVRRPLHVTGADGRHMQVRIEIGVGVVHLGREHEAVEDLLHEAQHLAEEARNVSSRAAMRDPVTGKTVPVEHAQLGSRKRQPRAARMMHAVGGGEGARA